MNNQTFRETNFRVRIAYSWTNFIEFFFLQMLDQNNEGKKALKLPAKYKINRIRFEVKSFNFSLKANRFDLR